MIEPSSVVASGEPMKFTVVVKGLKSNEDNSYYWSIDQGTIVEGQGTPSITVDTTGIEDATITATVSVSGNFLDACDHTASGVGVVAGQPKPVLTAEFSHSNCEILLLEVDNFAVRLQNDPSATGYIIVNGTPRARVGAEWQIKNFIKLRRFDPSRFVFLSGGGDSPAEIELWLVPPGADPPMPNTSALQTRTPEKFQMPTEPFIFSDEYADGVGGCSPPLDVEGYAALLKEYPKSRGNIVIFETSQKLFRQKEKEILNQLTKSGITRNRLRTFFKKVEAIQLQEAVQLWLLP